MDEFFNFVLEQLEVNIIKDPITSEVEFEVYDKITGPDVKVRDKNIMEAIQKLFSKISDREEECCK